jgi:hypothetical protein
MQEIKPWEPSWRQSLQERLQRAFQSGGVAPMRARRYSENLTGTGNTGVGVADFVPVLGAGLGVDEGTSQVGQGLGAMARGQVGSGLLDVGLGSAVTAASFIPGIGMVARRGAKAATQGRKASEPAVTGTKDATANVPVTMAGKNPSEWTPDEWKQFGEMHGVQNLGPLTPTKIIKDDNGRKIEIPGGLEGKFTYYDLLHLKSQGIDASQLPEATHAKLQQKMARSLQAAEGDKGQVWSGLAFGMTSPNNPLFPNQLAMSRLRSSDPAELDRLASFIDWAPGSPSVDTARRRAADAAIANAYGLSAGSAGGLGVRGTQDYTNLAELAALYRQNPEWFAKRSSEGWDDLAERTFSQLRGLSGKTGSFGVVFQDPLNAQISAMDRHMASIAGNRIFAGKADTKAFQDRALSLYNRNNADKAVKKFDQLPHAFVQSQMLNELGKHPNPLLRVLDRATSDRVLNPQVPERLRSEGWLAEPEKVEVFGDNYRRALAVNAEHAGEYGLGVFPSQWMQWDRKRRRLEPHENMFPGLEKLPRMSVDQLRAVDDVHRTAGFKNYTKENVNPETGDFRLKPTQPVSNPSRLGYFSLVPALGLPYLLGSNEERPAY